VAAKAVRPMIQIDILRWSNGERGWVGGVGSESLEEGERDGDRAAGSLILLNVGRICSISSGSVCEVRSDQCEGG